ncbi:unnamed protein product, partial [Citrullus colocynthis]
KERHRRRQALSDANDDDLKLLSFTCRWRHTDVGCGGDWLAGWVNGKGERRWRRELPRRWSAWLRERGLASCS